MLRNLRAAGMAALLAAALGAAPASAKSEETFPAVIDCGAGPVDVVAGIKLFEALVDVETGQRYKPIAWSVTFDGELIEARKGKRKRGVDCSYDDGMAVGTVTVKKA